MPIKIDYIDLKILSQLQNFGRMPIIELASLVNLSKTPCSLRVRRLEETGVIRGYRADIAPELMKAGHVLFVQVSLDQTSNDSLESFNDAVKRIPEVQNCFMLAANFDYLLKVRTDNIEHYRSVLRQKIGRLPNVSKTHSFVAMEIVKDDLTVPIPMSL